MFCFTTLSVTVLASAMFSCSSLRRMRGTCKSQTANSQNHSISAISSITSDSFHMSTLYAATAICCYSYMLLQLYAATAICDVMDIP